jgi:hypothetical protein
MTGRDAASSFAWVLHFVQNDRVLALAPLTIRLGATIRKSKYAAKK